MSFPNVNNGCCGGCRRGVIRPGACPPSGCKNVQFSSGVSPVVLTTLANGVVGEPSIIGCGTAVAGVISTDGNIYSTGPVPEAYTVQHAGAITNISASFTITTVYNVIGQDAIVHAQVYRAPAGSDIFMPTGASVDLAPALTSLLPVGTTLTGAMAVIPPVTVDCGDRLLVVFTMSGSIGDVASTVTGTASATVTIQ
ncbi:hypothetical protein [Sporosarcina sp. NPDC096371]|uniref:hypothetical protein n=1 Tax=Sporosarcina sp. NPDC096371 TaxID=3364530 RepID=UPI0037F7F6A4